MTLYKQAKADMFNSQNSTVLVLSIDCHQTYCNSRLLDLQQHCLKRGCELVRHCALPYTAQSKSCLLTASKLAAIQWLTMSCHVSVLQGKGSHVCWMPSFLQHQTVGMMSISMHVSLLLVIQDYDSTSTALTEHVQGNVHLLHTSLLSTAIGVTWICVLSYRVLSMLATLT